MKAKRSQKILYSIAGTYLVLLIVPMIMGISLYSYALNIAREYVTEANETALQNSVYSIEGMLTAADRFAATLLSSRPTMLSKNIRGMPHGSFAYSIREVTDGLPYYFDGMNIVSGYVIIDLRNDVVYAPRIGYPSTRAYYEAVIADGTDDYGYSQWYNDIYTLNHAALIGMGGDRITYGIPCFRLSDSGKHGRILFDINRDALLGAVYPLFDKSANAVSLYTPEGAMLAAQGNPMLGDVDLHASGTTSAVIN